MGTWGPGPFSNDVAEDWEDALCAQDGFEPIADAFQAILTADGTNDADPCQQAVAAAEVLSALRGYPARDLSDELREWISARPDPDDPQMLASAKQAVQQILDDSELKELWEGDRKWIKKLHQLLERLDQPAKTRRIRKPATVSLEEPPRNPTQAAQQLKQHGADIRYERRRPIDILFAGADVATDDVLQNLPVMQDVEYISIKTCPRVTDASLEVFARLPKLKSLLLEGASITNEGVAALGGITTLESLWLTDCDIGDSAMQHIQKLTGLTYLELSQTKITDAGCSAIASLKQLEMLDLQLTSITTAGVAAFAGLPNLWQLRLTKTRVDGEVCDILLEFPKLTEVSLISTQVTRDDVKRLRAGRPGLKVHLG